MGDEETWKISLEKNVWGFSENTKGAWNTSNVGDYLAFYVTLPLKKIIGFGRITKKYIGNEILWPDEKFIGRPLWIYKFSFDKIFVVDSWINGISVPNNIMLNVGRKVVTEDEFRMFVKNADSKWNSKMIYEILLK